MDLDTSTPTPVCLIRRELTRPEQLDAAEQWDGWYWECSAPGQIDSAANPTSDKFEKWRADSHLGSFALEVDPSLKENLAQSLASLDLLDDSTVPLWPIGTGSAESRLWITTKVRSDIHQNAAEWYAKELTAWMKCLNSSRYIEEIRLRSSNRISVMLLGRALENPVVRELLIEDTRTDSNGMTVSLSSTRDVVDGGLIFLQRLESGLPTFVDLLPDLYLQVTNSRGARRNMQLFRAEPVAPGQLIETSVEEQILLPAGKPYYSFPLSRTEAAGTPLSFHARLESPKFPLVTSVAARIHVAFRYAHDVFRVRVEPMDLSACEPIEIQWRRGAANTIDIENDPPEFPQSSTWNISSQSLIRFQREVESWTSQIELLFATSSFPQSCRRASANGSFAAEFNAKIREQEMHCRELKVQVQGLWQPLRDKEKCPAELLSSMRPMRDIAGELIGIESRNRKLSRNVHTLRGVPVSLQTSIKHLLDVR